MPLQCCEYSAVTLGTCKQILLGTWAPLLLTECSQVHFKVVQVGRKNSSYIFKKSSHKNASVLFTLKVNVFIYSSTFIDLSCLPKSIFSSLGFSLDSRPCVSRIYREK